jgi:hypothetical protein
VIRLTQKGKEVREYVNLSVGNFLDRFLIREPRASSFFYCFWVFFVGDAIRLVTEDYQGETDFFLDFFDYLRDRGDNLKIGR